MKITLVTDAWFPQVNGVVRTLDTVVTKLREQGNVVDVIAPQDFRTMACPSYPEIRLSLFPGRSVAARIAGFQPDAIHIATEGPLGIAARRYCRRRHLAFTTAYHTKFPEYVHLRTGLPLGLLYRLMRWFHGAAAGVLVATRSIAAELEAHGITRIKSWSRGVDLALFHPYPKDNLPGLNDMPRPISLYVGRLAVEKNIRAFLDAKIPGSKLVVGDGPQMDALRKAYPEVRFVGAKSGEELARHYAAVDIFVFPSLTDTFGLVNLEALACGVPVAAYPVAGPIDILGPAGRGVIVDFNQKIGAVDADLAQAIMTALEADPIACRAYAEHFSWTACADIFLGHLVRADSGFAVT